MPAMAFHQRILPCHAMPDSSPLPSLPPSLRLARAKNSIRSATKWPFQNRGVSNTRGFHDFTRISRVHNHSTKTKRRENLGRGLKRPVDSPSINPNFLSVPGPRQGEPNRIKERNVENAARARGAPTTDRGESDRIDGDCRRGDLADRHVRAPRWRWREGKTHNRKKVGDKNIARRGQQFLKKYDV